jgi:hypothetical protein
MSLLMSVLHRNENEIQGTKKPHCELWIEEDSLIVIATLFLLICLLYTLYDMTSLFFCHAANGMTRLSTTEVTIDRLIKS